MDIKLAIPVSGVFTKTFLFGEAPSWYVNQFKEPHNGIDYGVPIGTPVQVCDDGLLAWVDSVPDYDGCGLILTHSWGQSIYWHTSKIIATFGPVIPKGQLIALSGNTGFATGPHLHFGIKVFGQENNGMRGYVDPEPYFKEAVPVPTPPAPVGTRYHVKSGDTLWGIAQKFYGNGALWNKIYEANKDKIANPRLILTNWFLQIP